METTTIQIGDTCIWERKTPKQYVKNNEWEIKVKVIDIYEGKWGTREGVHTRAKCVLIDKISNLGDRIRSIDIANLKKITL